MRQFYTYVHYRSAGDPFYVGKGYGNRCHSRQQRSKAYLDIFLEFGPENIQTVVTNQPSEEVAFAAEKYFIALYRSQGFILVNRTSGGQGTSGMKHGPEARKKISDGHKGKPLSEAHKAAVSKGLAKRPIKYWPPKTPEAKARAGASRKGYKFTEEERRMHSIRMKNRRPISEEGRANLSASLLGKKHDPVRVEKTRLSILATNQRKRDQGISLAKSPEHKANISAALMGHKHSEQTKNKISRAHIGKKHTPEAIARMCGRKPTPEAIAKQIAR